MLDDNKYKNYSKRQEKTEIIENFGNFNNWPTAFPTTLEDVPKHIKKTKAKLKKLEKEGKVYSKTWFGLEEVYDEFRRRECNLVLRGTRLETDKELQSRVDRHLALRGSDIAGSILDIMYWLSDEGQKELKEVMAYKHRPPHIGHWVDVLDEIKEAKLKCLKEKK